MKAVDSATPLVSRPIVSSDDEGAVQVPLVKKWKVTLPAGVPPLPETVALSCTFT